MMQRAIEATEATEATQDTTGDVASDWLPPSLLSFVLAMRPVGTLPPPPLLLLLLLPVAAAISAVSPFSSRRTHNPSTLSALSALAALGPRRDWPGELAPSGLRGLLGAGCWVPYTAYCLLLSTSTSARPAANGEGDRRLGLGESSCYHSTMLP
jgi:hypothetical protein